MKKKLIPTYYYNSIYEIDYKELYEKGIRLILADMDNTLISYKETLPNEKLKAWKKEIEAMGFEIILVSNSRKHRVDTFAQAFNIKYQKFSTKPLTRGIRKAVKKLTSRKYKKNEMILIGDQLMTDIFAGNRYKINTILVHAIDTKSDIATTRFNRKLERFFLRRLKKKCPKEYNEKLSTYGGEFID